MVLFLLSILTIHCGILKLLYFNVSLLQCGNEFQKTALGVLELAKRLIFVTVVFKFEANRPNQ